MLWCTIQYNTIQYNTIVIFIYCLFASFSLESNYVCVLSGDDGLPWLFLYSSTSF
jgi:hypothetical protein